jgi:ABC-type multidrug transport system fused ATPase/permease subunit
MRLATAHRPRLLPRRAAARTPARTPARGRARVAARAAPKPRDAGAASADPLSPAFARALLARHAAPLLGAGAALVFCTACNLASPVLAGAIFDSLLEKAPASGGAAAAAAAAAAASSRRGKLLIALALVYAAEPLVTRVYVSTLVAAAERCLRAARARLFRALLAKPAPFFEAHSPASLAALLSADLDVVRAVALASTSRDRGPRALAEAVGAAVVLTCLSWRLGPVLALVIAGAGGTAAAYRLRTRPLEAAAATAAADVARTAATTLGAIATVRSYAGEPAALASFGRAANASAEAGLGFGRAKAGLEAASRAAVHASLLATYVLGSKLVAASLIQPGVMLTAIGFTYSLVYATTGAVQSAADFRRGAAALARARAAAAAAPPDPAVAAALPPEDEEERSGASAPAAGGAPRASPSSPGPALAAARAGADLALASASFAYPSRPAAPVLRSLSLTLKGGSVTALVGPSGAGKSTVASLLARLYAPTAGSVTLGGVDATRFAAGDWASAVTLVRAAPDIFDDTVAANIAYGAAAAGATRDDIIAAATAARAHDFIVSLPHGYDTVIGPGALSSGEAQRVQIARAILKAAPILLLDEATSALDARNEADVGAAATALADAGRTVLIIAHRLATCARADRVVVLDAGAVVEDGTHATLSAAGGLYARLVSAQALTLAAV